MCKCGLHPGFPIQTSTDRIAGCSFERSVFEYRFRLVNQCLIWKVLWKMDVENTSGYPWSNPIRLNNFSYELSLIGIFLDGLPGTIVLPQDNLYLPLDHSWDGPFGGSQDG